MRWRIIPTVLLGSLGVLIATIGVALFGRALVWIGEDLLPPDAAGRRVELLLSMLFELAFCLITTGTGALWIWSAALFWRQRWRGAVVTGLLGAIPVGLFLAI